MFTTEVKMYGKWVEVDSSNRVIDVIRTAQMFVETRGIEFVRVKQDGKIIV
jgi:hypothetical protein